MPLRVGGVQNEYLTVTVSADGTADADWRPAGNSNPNCTMRWVAPRVGATQHDEPAWVYGVSVPASPFTYPEMDALRLRPTTSRPTTQPTTQPTTLQKGRIRFMANNGARGLFEVYVIDPNKESIIHHCVLVAVDVEDAKLRSLLAAKISADDLDRYDVVVTVLGDVRAKKRPQEVKIIKED